MKKLNVKSMEKKVKEQGNLHLEDFYVTSDFSVESNEYPVAGKVHMMNNTEGYAIGLRKQLDFKLTDEFLLKYFEDLNILTPNVVGFILDENRVAFHVPTLNALKNKKVFRLNPFVYNGKLPMTIIGSQLYHDENGVYIVTKESNKPTERLVEYIDFEEEDKMKELIDTNTKVVAVTTTANDGVFSLFVKTE